MSTSLRGFSLALGHNFWLIFNFFFRMKDEVNLPSELVTLTYQMLQNQIFYMIELDITVFDLCEVNLSKAEVKSNGAVKMKTPEIINSVFTVLNEINNNNDIDISKVFDKENTSMEE